MKTAMISIAMGLALTMSAPAWAQEVKDAPVAGAPDVQLGQENPSKSDFLKPAATKEDMQQIQQAEQRQRLKDKKAKRSPASVSAPEFEKKKKSKKKKKKNAV